MVGVTAAWPAPYAARPVQARVTVPGSKSVTSRALLLAALSGGDTAVHGVPPSRDTALMIDALRTLGVPVALDGERAVVGAHDGLRGDTTVDCGLAGTVMRFVPPAAVLADGSVRFDGDPRARERPMAPMLAALRGIGARIEGDGLPFVVHGEGRLTGGEAVLDASASSQFVSGLLLCGASYDKGVHVHHRGAPGAPPLPSLPHIAMTVDMLRTAGVEVTESAGGSSWRVAPGPVQPREWQVEPDLSNAAAFLAAATATGGSVTVAGWPARTVQPGAAILGLLEQFGASVLLGPDGMTVNGPAAMLGVDVDLHDVGELAPVVAALAALAGGPSRLRGIAHLRGHETDRLAALATEINALGGSVSETADGLDIRAPRLRADPARPWRSYGDHRMATAGAVIGLAVPGVLVEDIECTAKTFPGFAQRWAAMLEPGR